MTPNSFFNISLPFLFEASEYIKNKYGTGILLTQNTDNLIIEESLNIHNNITENPTELIPVFTNQFLINYNNMTEHSISYSFDYSNHKIKSDNSINFIFLNLQTTNIFQILNTNATPFLNWEIYFSFNIFPLKYFSFEISHIKITDNINFNFDNKVLFEQEISSKSNIDFHLNIKKFKIIHSNSLFYLDNPISYGINNRTFNIPTISQSLILRFTDNLFYIDSNIELLFKINRINSLSVGFSISDIKLKNIYLTFSGDFLYSFYNKFTSFLIPFQIKALITNTSIITLGINPEFTVHNTGKFDYNLTITSGFSIFW